MEVTLAQATALRLLRWAGWELSNLRPLGRAVKLDAVRDGKPATLVVAPAGTYTHFGQRA